MGRDPSGMCVEQTMVTFKTTDYHNGTVESEAVDKCRIVLFGGNLITQFVDTENMRITNTTLDSHRYHPGDVVIDVDPFVAGSVISFTCDGTGPHASENRVVGLAFFGSVGLRIQSLCAAAPIFR